MLVTVATATVDEEAAGAAAGDGIADARDELVAVGDGLSAGAGGGVAELVATGVGAGVGGLGLSAPKSDEAANAHRYTAEILDMRRLLLRGYDMPGSGNRARLCR
jgi:hypothetical protein